MVHSGPTYGSVTRSVTPSRESVTRRGADFPPAGTVTLRSHRRRPGRRSARRRWSTIAGAPGPSRPDRGGVRQSWETLRRRDLGCASRLSPCANWRAGCVSRMIRRASRMSAGASLREWCARRIRLRTGRWHARPAGWVRRGRPPPRRREKYLGKTGGRATIAAPCPYWFPLNHDNPRRASRSAGARRWSVFLSPSRNWPGASALSPTKSSAIFRAATWRSSHSSTAR